MLSFCSNDYLGLASHPALATAAAAAAARDGFGASASRLVSRRPPGAPHPRVRPGRLPRPARRPRLPERLPDEHRRPDRPCGSGRPHRLRRPQPRQPGRRLPALPGPGRDLPPRRRPRRPPAAGRRRPVPAPSPGDRIAVQHGRRRRALWPPSPKRPPPPTASSSWTRPTRWASLARAAAVSAQSSGIVPDVLIGTLGKAVGSAGGFAAGAPRAARPAREPRPHVHLHHRAAARCRRRRRGRSRRLLAGPEGDRRRAHLAERRHALGERCSAAALVAAVPIGPIVPVVLGSESRALAVAAALRARGLFIPAIRPPTVPPGSVAAPDHSLRRPRARRRGPPGRRPSTRSSRERAARPVRHRNGHRRRQDAGRRRACCASRSAGAAHRSRSSRSRPAATPTRPTHAVSGAPPRRRSTWPTSACTRSRCRRPRRWRRRRRASGSTSSRVADRAHALGQRGGFLLVEGAGGLLVPYAGGETDGRPRRAHRPAPAGRRAHRARDHQPRRPDPGRSGAPPPAGRRLRPEPDRSPTTARTRAATPTSSPRSRDGARWASSRTCPPERPRRRRPPRRRARRRARRRHRLRPARLG